MGMRAVTERYEQRLWDELNLLLADVIPAEAKGEEAEDAIMAALAGGDSEIATLYRKIKEYDIKG